jgi:hypothetical protein
MDTYIPPETDLLIADHIESVIDEFLRGNVDGLALVAMRSNGSPLRMYINKTEEPVLREVLQNLISDYEANQSFRHRANAPLHNRSSRTH